MDEVQDLKDKLDRAEKHIKNLVTEINDRISGNTVKTLFGIETSSFVDFICEIESKSADRADAVFAKIIRLEQEVLNLEHIRGDLHSDLYAAELESKHLRDYLDLSRTDRELFANQVQNANDDVDRLRADNKRALDLITKLLLAQINKEDIQWAEDQIEALRR